MQSIDNIFDKLTIILTFFENKFKLSKKYNENNYMKLYVDCCVYVVEYILIEYYSKLILKTYY